jgi:hypothetical protein
MAKGNKTSRGKPATGAERAVPKPASSEPLTDPLNAFPADPPRQNVLLLIVSALLFAIWFSYLAYVALRS